jgi:hypothetical protein
VMTRTFGMRPSVYVITGTIGWKQLFEQAVCMCPACTVGGADLRSANGNSEWDATGARIRR